MSDDQTKQVMAHFSFRPVEIAALQSILINYALHPYHVQVWEDIVSDDTVTLGELMSKLIPNSRHSNWTGNDFRAPGI